MKILYLFAGTRKNLRQQENYPENQFYGLFALQRLGIEVDYIEFTDVYPRFLEKILPFNIRHMLMYFPARRYDIVFGSALMPMMLLQSFFKSRAKFVLLNISLTRLLASQSKKTLKKWLIKLALSKIDAVVCLSEAQSKYLNLHTNLSPDQIFVVPFGVDIKFYSKGSEKIDKTIISVGRDNGRDYKTVFSVAKQLPNRNFIVICSKRNILGLTPPKNVKVIYDLPPYQVVKLYRTSQFLLLLTHGNVLDDGADCSGQTVLLEAMATGLPAVLTDNPCLSEYVSDGEDALIVHPYDIESIIEKINQMDDINFRASLSKNARERVIRNHSAEVLAKNLLQVFQSIDK